MIFITIEYDYLANKDYIRFCSDEECITMELVDRHLSIYPFPGGRLPDECISELIYFLKDNEMKDKKQVAKKSDLKKMEKDIMKKDRKEDNKMYEKKKK